MKRTLLLVGLVSAFALANVRLYTDAPDPASGYHVRHGVVLIVPNVDQCYGLEYEHGTHIVEPYGGDCE